MNTLENNLRTLGQNKRLHALFGKLNITDKLQISEIVYGASNKRTIHSSELTFIECRDLITSLEEIFKRKRESQSAKIDTMRPDAPEKISLEKKRKGLLKSIFRWFELQGKVVTIDYVKGVACRAAKVENFNDITSSQLTTLYAEFCRKQRAREVMRPEDFDLSLN
jgi:hypothetical protein